MYVQYPRVTQVIGEMMPQEWLVQWRKKVGKRKAAKIQRESSTVGTIVHYRILKQLVKYPLPMPRFKIKNCPTNIKSLCEIAEHQWDVLQSSGTLQIEEERREIEKFTLEHDLKVCGTYDIGAHIRYRGEKPLWSIADLKTSPMAYESHFVQLGAYALFMDPYPDQGLVISLCPYVEKNPTLEAKVFKIDRPELERRSQEFIDMLNDFHEKYPDVKKFKYSK